MDAGEGAGSLSVRIHHHAAAACLAAVAGKYSGEFRVDRIRRSLRQLLSRRLGWCLFREVAEGKSDWTRRIHPLAKLSALLLRSCFQTHVNFSQIGDKLKDLYDGFNIAAIGTVVALATSGLLVSFVLQYLDNFAKSFVNALSMIVVGVAHASTSGDGMQLPLVIGIVLTSIAIEQYNLS